jgi:hypothetical protein
MHPIPSNTTAFSKDGDEEQVITVDEELSKIDIHNANDLKQKLWSRMTKHHLETYFRVGDLLIRMKRVLPTQLTSAQLIAQLTPQPRSGEYSINNMNAIVWMDSSILWGMNTHNVAVCYVFVDSPTIKPKPWNGRIDKIAGDGYRQVIVPSKLFHSNMALKLQETSGCSPDDVEERIRYWDKGLHKRRSYWCKLWKDPTTGHHLADLIVLERPSECPPLSIIESLDNFAKPYTPDKPRCNDHGANLSYIESSFPP